MRDSRRTLERMHNVSRRLILRIAPNDVTHLVAPPDPRYDAALFRPARLVLSFVDTTWICLMAAERNPPDSDSLLTGPMVLATRMALRLPWVTLAVAGLLALVSIWLSATRLGYRTSRLDLLNPSSDFNRLWIEYIEEFGDEDDAVVVVEGASRERVVPVLRELAAALGRQDQSFHAVLHEVDLSKVQAKGLHYLSSEELLGIERFLVGLDPIIRGDWSYLNLGNMTAGLGGRIEAAAAQAAAGQPEALAAVAAEQSRFAASLNAALSGAQQYESPWPPLPQSFATLHELRSEYLLTNEGRLGFILLRLAEGDDGFVPRGEATNVLRKIVQDTAERHPETTVGVTGLPIMEHDEMLASQSSMFWASLLSMLGVAVLFVAGFGGVRHALLANVVLLVGMAWSFGYATLAVGHLNILSVAFTVTLIGIGIDYGVYYVSRYMRARQSTSDVLTALLATTRAVGPGIATGAITTAIAFFSAGFTDFTGIAELGIIAGGGVLLCAVAELFVLPAAILIVDGGRLGKHMPHPLPVQSWLAPMFAAPRRCLIAAVAATVFLALGGSRLWYDHNLLNLQPVGLESVELERKLLAESDQSSWYALSIADSPEELLARKARFANLPSVERTEEIVSLLPVDVAAKRPIIERIGARLKSLPEQPEMIPLTAPADLDRLLARIERLAAGSAEGQGVAALRRTLAEVRLADGYERQSRWQQQSASELLQRLRALAAMTNPEPPQWSDLPASLVDRFVGQNGRHLLKIYGRGNIWDTQALDRFVHEVREVDPRATGNPLQAHEASLQMKRSYEQSALYAILVIGVVLLIDFRSLAHAALAALPLGVGMLQTFGLLGRLGIPLNPANMITLPLIMGIAIDYGVHVVHDFREQRGRYLISASTAVAVLVDGLTTLVGFGSLMIASHQGLQSLGRVLTIGISCCMFSSLVLLPLLLTWLTWDRKVETVESNEQSPPAPAAEFATASSGGSADEDPAILDLREALVVRRRHLPPAQPRPEAA
jgi:uncharacterized protein